MEKSIFTRSLAALLSMIALSFLTSCGIGDSGGAGGGSGNTQFASGTIIGFGSVIVNGIEFSRKPGLADDRVKLSFDNISSASENNLRIGMNVTIKGTINNANGTGQYESIEFQPDLRGPLDAVNGIDTSTNTLTVMGRKVQVAANTSFDSGISSLADISSALQPGEQPDLEISGNLDTSSGILTATRIARKALDFNALPEKIVAIKGKIETASVAAGASSGSFTIGTVSINFSAAALGSNTTIADIAAGSVVEVKGAFSGNVITASRVEKKNAVDAGVNDSVKLKGTANGGIVNNSFTINGPNGAITINTASATFQKSGVAATAAIVTAGATLEVEGILRADGSVAASKVYLEVEKTVKLEGNAAAGAFNAGTLTLNSVPVIISATTRLLDGPSQTLDPASIAGGDHLQISGVFDSSGKVTASQVQRTTASKTTFIQGPLTAISSPKLTLIGLITVDTSGVNQDTGFSDNRTGTVVKFSGPAAFFASLTSDGFTVVKAKGTITGTAMSASDVELEQPQ